MTVYILLSLGAMLLSVPLFLVFGIGSAAIALDVLGLPGHTLMQVSLDAISASCTACHRAFRDTPLNEKTR